ncbi:Tfp pilus assembly protein PilN [Beggiatoa alba B18LD]|uniref:Tfp pilus assembly protein PilN n=1 Tax=Beggiatoa alba B18LD TaxID=395493 RepID=I3CC37_9GAMM|nr:PilN domain-containing protein [Beggiatoa alba]EIJ41180.1 Tfp pilus assembly protein PilN [Beggiatoa alba B18LD]
MKLTIPPLLKRSATAQKADICLIVRGNALFHAEKQDLIAQDDESLLKLTATEIAEAARRLLPNTDQQARIALALPNDEFVATSLNLPTIAPANLKNAVHLQLPTLLPGVADPLLLAVQPQNHTGATVALWLSARRADELFTEFEKQGLFLATIFPRILIMLPSPADKAGYLIDEDDNTVTAIEWSGSAIRRWLHVLKADCADEEFNKQFQTNLAAFNQDNALYKGNTEAWDSLPMPISAVYGYGFLPTGTQKHTQQLQQRKKRRQLAVMAGVIVGLGILSLGYAIHRELRLERKLAEVKSRTVDVTQLRNEVVEIEDYLASVKNFPQQHITDLMNKLNELIPKNSWITGLKIETGVAELEGYSPNPPALLEILTNNPAFTEVAFIRPTQKEADKMEERFGIRFKLVGVDFPTYLAEHFKVEQ